MNAQTQQFVVMFYNDGAEWENYGVFATQEEAEAFINKLCAEASCYDFEAFEIITA